MADIKSGWLTSEFRYTAVIGLVTAFGEKLNLFDVSIFADDPLYMLIYRCVQVIILGATAIYYMNNRSGIKKNGQIPAPVILDNKREG